MFKEFKEFAMRGNVIDMAVGIIIGLAFGTIVQSLVNDVIMPPVGLLIGGVDFTDLFITLQQGTPPGPYETLELAQAAGAVTMNLGIFINAVISFLLVAFAVFLLVKAINRMRREKEEELNVPPEPPEPAAQEKLLAEIRDLLKVQTPRAPGATM